MDNTRPQAGFTERFRQMNEMRKNKKLLDFALVNNNGEQVWGHWLVMASMSPLIEEIAMSNGERRLLLKNISAESLEHIVNYMYTIEVNLTRDNVDNILAGASQLRMRYLQEACLDFLENN
ncbi:ring canal kelch protein-like [Adelges cooleyi]|uniref:ring canal kelch protein-like n=1 Tax=Adelges cooleyi TaxID=133065 RepID=UPI00217F232C|nr:ring canal kelch protein-like [Adelges cooleyi]